MGGWRASFHFCSFALFSQGHSPLQFIFRAVLRFPLNSVCKAAFSVITEDSIKYTIPHPFSCPWTFRLFAVFAKLNIASRAFSVFQVMSLREGSKRGILGQRLQVPFQCLGHLARLLCRFKAPAFSAKGQGLVLISLRSQQPVPQTILCPAPLSL